MQTNERWTLKWAHGEAEVQSLGGMLAPVRFDLGDGRSVSPLHVAPWGDDAQWPGLMRALRGEWPCLPFGTNDTPTDLPEGFTSHAADSEWRHGYSSNHMWQLSEQTAHRLKLRIDYPSHSEVESLERVIEANPDEPSLSVSLTIRVRRDVVLPFALHPTFAMPQTGLEVLACPYQAVHTYPFEIEAGSSKVVPNRTFASLTEVATSNGTFDLTRLPLPERTEELVQLAGCRPPFLLRYPADHAEVALDWNPDNLPDAIMWISNGGRAGAPWSGNNFALGVEPAQSFFDLGRVVSPPASHPLANRRGLALEAGKPRTIAYRLSAHGI